MHLCFFIAKRYLFSRKKQHAINIISAISTVGVAIGTTALIVILSVFNGIDLLLQQSTDSFTPDLTVSPLSGKFTAFDSALYRELRSAPPIAHFDNIVEEKALVKYDGKLAPVTVKGVEDDYAAHTRFDRNLVQGEFRLQSDDGYQAVIGYGLAAKLGIGLHFLTPLTFYYPRKSASAVSLSALNTARLYPSALFSSQQDIDGQYVLTGIDFARKLFGIENQISKIEIKLKSPEDLPSFKKALQSRYAGRYRITDKYEANRAFYAMMKSEKLAVFLILLFILLIASFNIVGSITMLILDKKEDLGIYKALGMTTRQIISIFKTEGQLITSGGALAGLILGILLCLAQEKFGFISLGDGSYIITAYPVKLVPGDVLSIIATVLFIGYAASYFPVKFLVRRLVDHPIKKPRKPRTNL